MVARPGQPFAFFAFGVRDLGPAFITSPRRYCLEIVLQRIVNTLDGSASRPYESETKVPHSKSERPERPCYFKEIYFTILFNKSLKHK